MKRLFSHGIRYPFISGPRKALTFVILPLLSLIITEIINTKSVTVPFEKMVENPIAFGLNAVIHALLFFTVFFFVGRINISWPISTGIITALSLTSYFKSMIRTDPFVPTDIVMAGNVVGGEAVFTDNILMYVLPIFSVALIVVISLFIPRGKVFKKKALRILLAVVFLCASVVYSVFVLMNTPLLRALDITFDPYIAQEEFENNGFLLSFTHGFNFISPKEPDGYSQERVNKITSSAEWRADGTDSKTPNLIFIMAEAFYDFTEYEDVTTNKDPFPIFHSLKENGIHGKLNVAIFGGGTADTEFEVLTSLSKDFLPVGTVAYMNFCSDKVYSVVDLLNSQGYYTSAIHPYYKEYWNREHVYAMMGFDRFVGIDDINDPIISGKYISNETVFDTIIKEYEASGDDPFFTYTVTIENHYPFYPGLDKDARDVFITSDLSASSKEYIESFFVGAQNDDKLLGDLIEYFEKVDEPTVIVFFGDHLPIDGGYNTVYDELGISSDVYLKFTQEFVVWSNLEETVEEDLGMVDATFLVPTVLERYGLKTTPYYNWMLSVHSTIGAYGLSRVFDENGELPLTEETGDLLKDLKAIQYSLLFNK